MVEQIDSQSATVETQEPTSLSAEQESRLSDFTNAAAHGWITKEALIGLLRNHNLPIPTAEQLAKLNTHKEVAPKPVSVDPRLNYRTSQGFYPGGDTLPTKKS